MVDNPYLTDEYTALFQASQPGAALPLLGDDYLHKLVQIPFHLPPLSLTDVDSFVQTQAMRSGQSLGELTRQALARGLAPNPRQIKRAPNIFQLVRTIADERVRQRRLDQQTMVEGLLAKTVVIQTQYLAFYEQWRRYPTLAQTYEEAVRRQPMEEAEHVRGRRVAGQEPETQDDAEARRGGVLEPFLRDRERYALLERMMRYPEAPVNEQTGERGRFEGRSRDPHPGVSWTGHAGVNIPDIAWGEAMLAGKYNLGATRRQMSRRVGLSR